MPKQSQKRGKGRKKRPKKQEDPAKAMFDRLENGLQFMRQCPLCKESYQEGSLRVLLEAEPLYLVHQRCVACANAILAIVTVSDIGMTSVGLYTDLSADDVVHFAHRPPIAEDDVLDFHTYLTHKQDDFISLLQKH